MGICFMGNFLLIIYVAVSLNKMVQYFFAPKRPGPNGTIATKGTGPNESK